MGWNHRILAHKHKDEVYLQIHEVYYDENGKPYGYTENPISIGSETIKGITWQLNRMIECRKKPILWAGDDFPNECKIKYTCNLCGRNKFDKPAPHKCKGGYRKRGLQWSISYR